MPLYHCLIIDDEPLDQLMTQAMVKRHPFLQLEGIFSNAADALSRIEKGGIDVVFLDIEMPGTDGMELRSKAMEVPACIFITSYPEYAVDSFELAALDFIIKPLSAERFATAMQRLEVFLELKRKAELFDYNVGGNYIFIKEGTKQVKVRLQDVLYLEALRDYTRVATASRKYCVLGTLQHMLEQKEFQKFLRIHRSYAVQPLHVSGIESGHVIAGTEALPVGRTYKDALQQLQPGKLL